MKHTHTVCIGIGGAGSENAAGGSETPSAPTPEITETPEITATPDGTTITVPVTGSENTVDVTAKVEENKATVNEIKTEEIQKVIEGDKDVNIEVDLTGLDKKIDTVILPNKSMEEIAKAAADKTNKVEGFTVKLSTATV